MRLGKVQVHRIHHFLRGMWAGHGQHAGVHLPHHVAAVLAGFGTQATGHDDTAIGGKRFSNRVQAFLDGIVNKAAGVDDDKICTFKGFRGLVALGAQLRQDQLRIGQCLGAAKTDKANAWGGFMGNGCGGGNNFAHGSIVSEPQNISV